MKRSLLVVLFLLSLLVVVVGYFFFKKTDKPNPLSIQPATETSVNTSDRCQSYQNAADCEKDIYCKPQMGESGPASDKTGMPLANSVFDKCLDRNPTEVEVLKKNQELCLQDGANWLGTSCSCPRSAIPNIDPDSTAVFVKDMGCMSSKQICEQNGGVWTKPSLSTELSYCMVNGQRKDVGERSQSILVPN